MSLQALQSEIERKAQQEAASILESGYAYQIPELRLKKRETLGLPPLPKGNPESIKKTLKETSFFKCAEKKWT